MCCIGTPTIIEEFFLAREVLGIATNAQRIRICNNQTREFDEHSSIGLLAIENVRDDAIGKVDIFSSNLLINVLEEESGVYPTR